MNEKEERFRHCTSGLRFPQSGVFFLFIVLACPNRIQQVPTVQRVRHFSTKSVGQSRKGTKEDGVDEWKKGKSSLSFESFSDQSLKLLERKFSLSSPTGNNDQSQERESENGREEQED